MLKIKQFCFKYEDNPMS